MKTALITGSAGLIGSEAARFFANKGFNVVGIDNDMRSYFFGEQASTAWNRTRLEEEIPTYTHHSVDIRSVEEIQRIFMDYSSSIDLVLHTAAQPSHDWAAREPLTDFTINANGTLNLLEMTRRFSPKAKFIFTSTNKVYGDTPNLLPLVEHASRWELNNAHRFYSNGIDESMSIDHSTHSLFGASKVAADILVQEYGRYFEMYTATFRGGCLTGPAHSGTQLHGFLSYLVKCVLTGSQYTVFGYRGKQVRDNIHSYDLVNMFWHYYKSPRVGVVYNAGGGRNSNCSMLEAISACEKMTDKTLNWTYSDQNRIGDHKWWISDVSKFSAHYPEWSYRYDMDSILREIVLGVDRLL